MDRDTLIMILDAIRVGCAASSRHLKTERDRETTEPVQMPLVTRAQPEPAPEEAVNGKGREAVNGKGRRDNIKGQRRRSRVSQRVQPAGELEYLYTSDGYSRVARELDLGGFKQYVDEDQRIRAYVWLTEGERHLVKTEHLARLRKGRQVKAAGTMSSCRTQEGQP